MSTDHFNHATPPRPKRRPLPPQPAMFRLYAPVYQPPAAQPPTEDDGGRKKGAAEVGWPQPPAPAVMSTLSPIEKPPHAKIADKDEEDPVDERLSAADDTKWKDSKETEDNDSDKDSITGEINEKSPAHEESPKPPSHKSPISKFGTADTSSHMTPKKNNSAAVKNKNEYNDAGSRFSDSDLDDERSPKLTFPKSAIKRPRNSASAVAYAKRMAEKEAVEEKKVRQGKRDKHSVARSASARTKAFTASKMRGKQVSAKKAGEGKQKKAATTEVKKPKFTHNLLLKYAPKDAQKPARVAKGKISNGGGIAASIPRKKAAAQEAKTKAGENLTCVTPAEGLPKGWTTEKVTSAKNNRFDLYWYSPAKSYQFCSMAQVTRFLTGLERVVNGGDECQEEEKAMKLYLEGDENVRIPLERPARKAAVSAAAGSGSKSNVKGSVVRKSTRTKKLKLDCLKTPPEKLMANKNNEKDAGMPAEKTDIEPLTREPRQRRSRSSRRSLHSTEASFPYFDRAKKSGVPAEAETKPHKKISAKKKEAKSIEPHTLPSLNAESFGRESRTRRSRSSRRSLRSTESSLPYFDRMQKPKFSAELELGSPVKMSAKERNVKFNEPAKMQVQEIDVQAPRPELERKSCDSHPKPSSAKNAEVAEEKEPSKTMLAEKRDAKADKEEPGESSEEEPKKVSSEGKDKISDDGEPEKRRNSSSGKLSAKKMNAKPPDVDAVTRRRSRRNVPAQDEPEKTQEKLSVYEEVKSPEEELAKKKDTKSPVQEPEEKTSGSLKQARSAETEDKAQTMSSPHKANRSSTTPKAPAEAAPRRSSRSRSAVPESITYKPEEVASGYPVCPKEEEGKDSKVPSTAPEKETTKRRPKRSRKLSLAAEEAYHNRLEEVASKPRAPRKGKDTPNTTKRTRRKTCQVAKELVSNLEESVDISTYPLVPIGCHDYKYYADVLGFAESYLVHNDESGFEFTNAASDRVIVIGKDEDNYIIQVLFDSRSKDEKGRLYEFPSADFHQNYSKTAKRSNAKAKQPKRKTLAVPDEMVSNRAVAQGSKRERDPSEDEEVADLNGNKEEETSEEEEEITGRGRKRKRSLAAKEAIKNERAMLVIEKYADDEETKLAVSSKVSFAATSSKRSKLKSSARKADGDKSYHGPSNRSPNVRGSATSTWKERIAMLKAHKEVYNSCNLNYAPKESVNCLLRNFVMESRKQYKRFQRGEKSSLTTARISELQQMGFDFCPLISGGSKENHERRYQKLWDIKFRELEKYHAKHGDCLVSCVRAKETQLGNWVRGQRKLMNKLGRKGFHPQRLAKLEALGFDFDPMASGSYIAKKREVNFPKINANWEKHYKHLVRYKEEHGNVIIGPKNKDWPGLYDWVHSQRKEYKRWAAGDGKALMFDKWITKMNQLGFDWAPMQGDGFSQMLYKRSSKRYDDLWKEHYQDLKKFREENGHCNAYRSRVTELLAGWIHCQRKYKRNHDLGKKTPLTEERIRLLNELDFDWNPSLSGGLNKSQEEDDHAWDAVFQELCAFKKKHGHVDPMEAEPKLGPWVAEMRKLYLQNADGKTTSLTDRKIMKLESIGFMFVDGIAV